jgi:hypothetical protein
MMRNAAEDVGVKYIHRLRHADDCNLVARVGDSKHQLLQRSHVLDVHGAL